MPQSDGRSVGRSVVLRSPALLLKELEVVERASSGKHWFSAVHGKSLAATSLYRLLKNAPFPWTLATLRVVHSLGQSLYRWRDNPVRSSCEAVCRVAGRAGHLHQPEEVYRQFLANTLAIGENYARLYRHGIESVLDAVTIDPGDASVVLDLIGKHGGAVMAAPHNLGSAFSSLKLNRTFPLVIVARNSRTIARTTMALDFFERMEVHVLMVRGGRPLQLSRALFQALRSGTLVAATVDNLRPPERAVAVHMFGQPVGLAPWAAKIAAHLRVPMVPAYFRSRGSGVAVTFGEPIVTDDVRAAVEHYAGFFARSILEDPASWAYLADRKWNRVLRSAGARQ